MDVARIDESIRQALRAVVDLDEAPDILTTDVNLFAVGLKSLSSLRLVLLLEDEFGIQFSEDLLTRETFSTIIRIREAIVALITSQQTACYGQSGAMSA
jgi:acyl carrier protein